MSRPLPPVALASKSPRRRELLESHGLRHAVVDADIDDSDLAPGGSCPRAWVMSLAYLKAAAGLAQAGRSLDADWVVLGADTICVQDGRIIGQPGDAAEAEAIVQGFCGRTHEVLTGVALIEADSGKRVIFLEIASVEVGLIGDREVDSYIRSGCWRGKAGAYNLTERLEAGWPITYCGDADGIMGLPMGALKARLSELVEI
jgi:nucleoside triphosphate pyrophosphatase